MIKPILVFDCHYLCHRAKFKLKWLSHNEQSTGVIFGFLNSILSLSELLAPYGGRYVFAWDSAKSLRRKHYPLYKKKDKQFTDEEERLHNISMPQFTILRDYILPKMGFKNVFMQVGYEADDIIASVAKKYCAESNVSDYCIVISRDQDLYQLLSHCIIYDTEKKNYYSSVDFEKEYGITPKDWVLVKQIAGCSGDNVPNIEGVKEKIAIKYIKGELPKHTKAFQRIESVEGKKLIESNKILVELPFLGTRSFDVQEDSLSTRDFIDICNEYLLLSFINTKRFDSWKKTFNME